MPPDFGEQVRVWQLFYSILAPSAATLLGLLFIALSINQLGTKAAKDTWFHWVAGNTFGSFITVVIIALIMVVPDLASTLLALIMLVFGLAIAATNVFALRGAFRRKRSRVFAQLVIGLGVNVAAGGGLAVAAVSLLADAASIFSWLALILLVLLLAALNTAYSLLTDFPSVNPERA